MSTDLDSTTPPTAVAEPTSAVPSDGRSHRSWTSILVYLVLPLVIVALSGLAGWLKWTDGASREARWAAGESVHSGPDGPCRYLTIDALRSGTRKGG